jgi:hypothetical protein
MGVSILVFDAPTTKDTATAHPYKPSSSRILSVRVVGWSISQRRKGFDTRTNGESLQDRMSCQSNREPLAENYTSS